MRAHKVLDQELFRQSGVKPPPLPAGFGRYQTAFDAVDTEWLILEARRRGLSVQQVIRACVAQARAKSAASSSDPSPPS